MAVDFSQRCIQIFRWKLCIKTIEYTRIRNKWETWYTTQYNQGHESEILVSKRKSVLTDFLVRNGISEVDSVLDVGGDLGQYIPIFQKDTKRFVVDYSDRRLVAGVERVSHLNAVHNLDLVIYAHVLEHVSNPSSELADLLSRTKYLYVEVPLGVPSTSRLRRSHVAQLVGLLLSLTTVGWSLFSKPSAGRTNTAKLLRQSEHLNFFNETTLLRLSQILDCEVKITVNTIPTPDGNVARVIQALFINNERKAKKGYD